MSGPIKLALGVPAYGGKVDAAHAATWLALGFALRDAERFFVPILGPATPNTQPTCRARNTMLREAIAADADWLLMIDADVAHEGEGLSGGYDILSMVRAGHKAGAAIIGAAAPQRTDGPGHLMAYVETGEDKLTGEDGAGFRPVTAAEIGEGPTPVARVSGSLWAVNVQWVKACMPHPPWFVFAYAAGTLRMLGEDLWFCDRVRERGGAILCDGRFRPRHRRPDGWMP